MSPPSPLSYPSDLADCKLCEAALCTSCLVLQIFILMTNFPGVNSDINGCHLKTRVLSLAGALWVHTVLQHQAVALDGALGVNATWNNGTGYVTLCNEKSKQGNIVF